MEYKHTWEIDPQSFIYRWPTWLYNVRRWNFCKLFWAWVFFVPAAVLMGILFSICWPFIKLVDWWDDHKRLHPRPYMPSTPAKVKTGPNKAERFFDWFGEKVSKLVMFLQSHAGFIRAVFGAFVIFWIVVLAAAIIYVVQIDFSITLLVLMWTGIIAVGVLLLIGIVLLLDHIGLFRGAGKGLAAFGRFMAAGYYAVKTNTCPDIVIKSKKE